MRHTPPSHPIYFSLPPTRQPHSAGPLSLTYLMIYKPEIIFMFYMCLITFVLVLFIYFYWQQICMADVIVIKVRVKGIALFGVSMQTLLSYLFRLFFFFVLI